MRVLTGIVCVLLLLTSGLADAQNTSRKTFVELMDVQELWGEERYDEALVKLQALAEKNAGNDYDQAVTLQYLAHTAYLAGKVELAKPALARAAEIPGLPDKLVADIKLLYGQIVIGDEEFHLAVELLEDWYLKTEVEKQASQVFSLAYAHYRIGNLPRAEILLEESLATSTRINNNWFRVYYQVLFDQKKFDKAEDIIFGLVTRDPNSDAYWSMMANHFQAIEDSKRALSAMAIADLQELLDGAEDQRRLASMYGFVEIPEKSARTLEAAIEAGGIEADPKTLRRLGDLWLLARDRDRAMDYLDRAAAVAPDGKTYELLASLYFEDERWKDAHETFLQALDSGGLEAPEMVHLLAGICAYRAGMNEEARLWLNRARESEEHRAQAELILRRMRQDSSSD